MADAIRYIHPQESISHTMDFQDVLPSADSAIAAVGSGSSVKAIDSVGTDRTADILTGSAISSKTLATTIHNVLEGQEYVLTFWGQGATSGQRFVKTLLVLGRSQLTGEF